MSRVQDYPTLCQAVQDFTHRPDLGPYLDYFVQGGEDRIYRKVLELNEGMGLKWMEATLSGVTDPTVGNMAVPADYFTMKGAQVVVGEGTYDLITKEPQWIYSHYPVRSAQGPPAYIAREGANFIFGPFPDSSYSIVGTYYNRAPALTTSNPTSWMTANIPMTLLAGCLIEAYKFLRDVPSVQAWTAEFTDRLTDICSADKAERYAGGALVIDTGNPTLLGL